MVVVLGLLGLVGSVVGAEADVISQAEGLFERGEYGKGVELLTAAQSDEGLTSERRCDVSGALALVHEEFTGNYAEALDCYRLVLRADVLPTHAVKSSARVNMMRIESLSRKYGEQNAVLEGLSAGDIERICKGIPWLEKIAVETPEYYRLAEVYYYLGVGYVSLGEYERGAEALAKALKLKPGLDTWLSVDEHVETAEGQVKANGIEKQRWAVSGVLLVMAVIVVCISKPWRRGRVTD